MEIKLKRPTKSLDHNVSNKLLIKKNPVHNFMHSHSLPHAIYMLAQNDLFLHSNKWASLWENRSSGFPTRSDTNWSVQPQKMAKGLKFRIQEVKGLYYLYSENKGADQLRGYREAGLRLCFRICKKLVFSGRGSNIKLQSLCIPFTMWWLSTVFCHSLRW